MTLKVQRRDLVDALRVVERTAALNGSMPILKQVLVEKVKGGLSLASTDLEVSTRIFVPTKGRIRSAASIHPQPLRKALSKLNTDEILLDTNPEALRIHAGEISLEFHSTDPKEWPVLPSVGDTTEREILESETIHKLVSGTLFAVCGDLTRYNLNGVYVDTENERLRWVATDGRRLGLVEPPVSVAPIGSGMILPRHFLETLAKLAKSKRANGSAFELRADERIFEVSCGDVRLSCRSIDGEYPNYRNVIPKSPGACAAFDVGTFGEAVDVCVAMSSNRTLKVAKLKLEADRIEFTSSDVDNGTSTISISAEVETEAQGMEIAFHAPYLVDWVKSVRGAGRALVRVQNPVSPATFSVPDDERFVGVRCVVMPCRI